MRDDHIQGILFSGVELVDLTPHSHQQRMLLKMLAAKHRMHSWVTYLHSLSPISPDSKSKDFAVVRGGKHRQADIRELADRLKGLN